MRVLIIGGTGNISSAIAAQLIGRGDQVVLYNRGKIRPQFEGEYQVIVGDRTDHARFEAQVRQAGVFDCAIDMIGYEPEDAHSAVRACRGRVGRFVFCSTVDVYTKSGARYPVREDAERSPAPAFPYAYKKAQLERILEAAQEEGAFLLTITRPAATYNDSSAPIPLVGKGTLVFHRLRRGLPLILLGDGTSLWVIWHRDDVARAFVAALDNPAAAGRSYHVTGEQWLTWEIYYQTAARVLGVQADFARIPPELFGAHGTRSGRVVRHQLLFQQPVRQRCRQGRPGLLLHDHLGRGRAAHGGLPRRAGSHRCLPARAAVRPHRRGLGKIERCGARAGTGRCWSGAAMKGRRRFLKQG